MVNLFTSNLLIIWLAIVVLIAGLHLYIIKGRKVSPNKALWLGIRIAIACVIGYLDWRQGVRPLELIVVSYFFSGWFLHNSILGWKLHGMPWYTNKTGPMDKPFNSNPWAWLILGIGFVTSVIMYFLNE